MKLPFEKKCLDPGNDLEKPESLICQKSGNPSVWSKRPMIKISGCRIRLQTSQVPLLQCFDC